MLLTLNAASVPVLIALVVFGNDVVYAPVVLIRMFVVLTMLPAVVAWLIVRASTANVEVTPALLVLRRRGLRVEVPSSAIGAVMPWHVPLPGVGLALRMRSGRRLPHRLQSRDAPALLAALAEQGGVDDAGRALRHPSIVYAAAKRREPPSRWYHVAGKFPLFALLPTAVLFNAHQHIAYGALLGEYYLLGPGSWLTTLAVYWATLTIYLILYASMWRGFAEAAALLTAWMAPSHAVRARRGAEVVCRVVYYGGVPVLLAMRFLP